VERVEPADEPLGGRPTETAPRPAHRVREGQRHDPPLCVDPVQRGVEAVAAAEGRRRERDELVFPAGRLRHPPQRAADVVADAGPRMRQRTDVVDDPHFGL
jgi:hypothetical protein